MGFAIGRDDAAECVNITLMDNSIKCSVVIRFAYILNMKYRPNILDLCDSYCNVHWHFRKETSVMDCR